VRQLHDQEDRQRDQDGFIGFTDLAF
jgi:hypothetical protein